MDMSMNVYQKKTKSITTKVLINNIYLSNRRIDKIDKFGAPPMSRSPSFLGRETSMVVVTRFSPGALCKHCGVSSSAAWEESLVYPVCVTVMTEWVRKQKKRMREIRCVSRTTVYNFCLSLSLPPPRLPPPCCRLPGIFQSLLFVCFTHARMSSAVDCLFFCLFVTLYLCLCLCLCLTRDDLEMRFRAQVHVCISRLTLS